MVKLQVLSVLYTQSVLIICFIFTNPRLYLSSLGIVVTTHPLFSGHVVKVKRGLDVENFLLNV